MKKTLLSLLVAGVVGRWLARLMRGETGEQHEDGTARHQRTDPQGERSARVVLGFYHEVLAKKQLERAGDFMREDYIQHSPGLKQGLKGYLEDYQLFHSVFPDLTATISQVVPQHDKVMLLATFTGHHVHTGKELVFETAELYRVQDGKLAEHWDAVDYAAMEAFGVTLPDGVQPGTRTRWRGTAQQRLRLMTLFYTVNTFYRNPDAPAPASIAEDLIQHQRGVGPGRKAFEENVQSYRDRFPDLRFEIKHTVAAKDRVVVFWVWHGREKDTGKQLRLNRADVFRATGWQLTEHWSRLDYRAVNPFGLQ